MTYGAIRIPDRPCRPRPAARRRRGPPRARRRPRASLRRRTTIPAAADVSRPSAIARGVRRHGAAVVGEEAGPRRDQARAAGHLAHRVLQLVEARRGRRPCRPRACRRRTRSCPRPCATRWTRSRAGRAARERAVRPSRSGCARGGARDARGERGHPVRELLGASGELSSRRSASGRQPVESWDAPAAVFAMPEASGAMPAASCCVPAASCVAPSARAVTPVARSDAPVADAAIACSSWGADAAS